MMFPLSFLILVLCVFLVNLVILIHFIDLLKERAFGFIGFSLLFATFCFFLQERKL